MLSRPLPEYFRFCAVPCMFILTNINNLETQPLKSQINNTSILNPAHFDISSWVPLSTFPLTDAPCSQKWQGWQLLAVSEFNCSVKCNNGATYPRCNWIFIWHRPFLLALPYGELLSKVGCIFLFNYTGSDQGQIKKNHIRGRQSLCKIKLWNCFWAAGRLIHRVMLCLFESQMGYFKVLF